MERDDAFSTFTPVELARALYVELADLLRAAVASVARSSGLDLDTLLAEVQADLAVRLLEGRFANHDSRRSSFKTYLAAAARNRARDILRSMGRMTYFVELTDGDFLLELPGAAEQPVDQLLAEEEREALLEALRDLEAEDAVAVYILRARYLEGLSYEEIAAHIGATSVEAVHVRAHRARRALERRLPSRAEELSAVA